MVSKGHHALLFRLVQGQGLNGLLAQDQEFVQEFFFFGLVFDFFGDFVHLGADFGVQKGLFLLVGLVTDLSDSPVQFVLKFRESVSGSSLIRTVSSDCFLSSSASRSRATMRTSEC
jgi:hypothetical protein